MAPHFGDVLWNAIDRAGNCACVGIDPDLDRIEPRDADPPAAAIERWSMGIIEAVAGVVPVVKPQAACFERYGSAGFAALERVVAAARDAGLIVLLDAKRGDIGVSARHYAASAAGMGAHAVTVNAYLGRSAVHPFLDEQLGVFVLVRTSNPDSDEFQQVRTADGDTVAETMAEIVHVIGDAARGAKGLSAVGAVVGATKSGNAAALREAMPDQPFLMPGIGAQGAGVADIVPLARDTRGRLADLGLLPTASRSVTYPESDGADAVRTAAQAFAEQTRGLLQEMN